MLGACKGPTVCSALEGSKDWAAGVRCTDEIKCLLLALDKQSLVAQTKKKKKMCRRLAAEDQGKD